MSLRISCRAAFASVTLDQLHTSTLLSFGRQMGAGRGSSVRRRCFSFSGFKLLFIAACIMHFRRSRHVAASSKHVIDVDRSRRTGTDSEHCGASDGDRDVIKRLDIIKTFQNEKGEVFRAFASCAPADAFERDFQTIFLGIVHHCWRYVPNIFTLRFRCR